MGAACLDDDHEPDLGLETAEEAAVAATGARVQQVASAAEEDTPGVEQHVLEVWRGTQSEVIRAM